MDQQPPPGFTSVDGGGALPPPNFGPPAANQMVGSAQPSRLAPSARRSVDIVALLGTALAIIVWLVRMFGDIGRLRKLWSGAWQIDVPLLVVLGGLVVALVLTALRLSAGPGLAAGFGFSVLSWTVVNTPVRPRSEILERAIGPAAILAAGMLVAAAVQQSRNQRSHLIRVVLPACLAIAMLMLGQVSTRSINVPYFDVWCYIALAIGFALATRVGWWMAAAALLFAGSRGVLFLMSSSRARRDIVGTRTLELLCGVALGIVCLVLAVKSAEHEQHTLGSDHRVASMSDT
jgi:hypothetical protein